MAWIREWGWRLAILALPWQTRWFQDGMTLGGLPWEQGRWAFYLSWIFLGLAVLAACVEPFKPAEHPLSAKAWTALVGVLLISLPACVSIFPPAAWQWLIQISFLVLLAWSLMHLKVDRNEFLLWCVIAIVPEALLGIGQFLSQQVIGSKWLGMASQSPAISGVSVVEGPAGRVLRAYGALPHPNILGGWLAFGLAACMLLAQRIKQRKWLSMAGALFAVCLVLTFSRSAWIAAALGLIVAFIMGWRKAWTLADKQRVLLLSAVILVSAGITAFMVRDLVLVRTTDDTRLEQMSTNERWNSMVAAWNLVPQHLWLGTGPNTAILALNQAGSGIVPPHFTLLLILLETGILGFIGFLLLLWRWLRASGTVALLPLLILLPLGLFDHYLWSLWAGQCLVMLAAVYPLTKDGK